VMTISPGRATSWLHLPQAGDELFLPLWYYCFQPSSLSGSGAWQGGAEVNATIGVFINAFYATFSRTRSSQFQEGQSQ